MSAAERINHLEFESAEYICMKGAVVDNIKIG